MSTTKTKASKRQANGAQPAPELTDVLTLTEAAAYLRVTEEAVLQMVSTQGLPARKIIDQWRFLKSAIQDWLRTPPPRTGKEALAAVVGSWKDDPELEPMLNEIYRQRGRPMTEDEP